jgi:phage terminase small subunit
MEKWMKGARDTDGTGAFSKNLQIEVFVPDGVPFVPEHLSDDAQACAQFIIDNYKHKMITSLDSFVLSIFSSAWAIHKMALEAINQREFVPIDLDDNGRPVKSKWFDILNEQARIMMQAAPKLFLTPADRTSIRLERDAPPKSKFDGLLGQTASFALSNASRFPRASGPEETLSLENSSDGSSGTATSPTASTRKDSSGARSSRSRGKTGRPH